MKFFKRDIPPRAALAVVALVLIASIVNGREQEPEAPPPARAARESAPTDTLANLDIDKLKRTAQPEAVTDVLAHRSLLPAAPAAGSESGTGGADGTPETPVAPPLPFTYLGRLIDGGNTTVFVARGQEHYTLEAGMKIDASYRVERIADGRVTFVYVPLGTRQTLVVPSLD